ncbi:MULTISPECIES: efflux transporter outer membrane subunit [Enterobacteriaceae]|uniref:efflux transporter outer membrane subunit n=2 Tax=Enterobacterales TaxID=91347 RepID=UPI000989BFB0
MTNKTNMINHKAYVLMPMLLTVTLTACNLQPHYDRPAMPVPSQWNQPSGAGTSATNMDWQQFFSNPALHQLIQLALDNNRNLRMAVLNVESARARYGVQRAAQLPTVSAGASQTSTHLPGNLWQTQSTGPATYHQYEANLGVTSWELDFFGRVRSLRDQALETYLSTEATSQATRISLIADVVTGYLALGANSDLLRLARSTADSQRQSYNLTKRGHDLGVSSEQDLVQAETSLKSAEADVAIYTRQVQQDANALRLLLGTELPARLTDSASLNNNWHFPALPAGLPSDLLTRRPDIIAAEHQLKAANANIGAARAAFFPSISLTTYGGSASSSLGHLLGAGTANWSFIPFISMPIFDGGKNQANLDIAEVQKRIEVANYEKAIQTAFKEVSDALAGQATYQDELTAREQDTAASQRYFDMAQMRYRQGMDNYLNILVSQRSLYQAQKTQIATQLSMLSQQITLYKVLGGGWKS